MVAAVMYTTMQTNKARFHTAVLVMSLVAGLGTVQHLDAQKPGDAQPPVGTGKPATPGGATPAKPSVPGSAAPKPATAPGAAAKPIVAPDAPAPVLAPDYVIGAGDVLAVVFWRQQEMSSEVVVRPDGRISVPLLNDSRGQGFDARSAPVEIDDRSPEVRPGPERHCDRQADQ